MARRNKKFEPDWYRGEIPADSYRSIFKWGGSEKTRIPGEAFFRVIRQRLGLFDKDFETYREDLGLDAVRLTKPSGLSGSQLNRFWEIAGKKFVRTDDYARLSVACGKSMYDLIRMRNKTVENIPDAVIYPNTKEQIEAIVAYCASERIPLYVYGGGSSLTRGAECVKGGVSLDMRLRFNKVVGFNEIDQTITVEAGMNGSKLEALLNNAEKEFGGKRPYTCGHFPRSFESSTVGGWVMTGGSGRNSSYYGGIRDIVLGGDYATPAGTISTDRYSSNKAAGSDLDQIMVGSEGAFGVLTHVTLKVFRLYPRARQFSCVFKDWETAQAAAREIMQGEGGFPSVFRLSDPEETDILMHAFGVTENFLGRVLWARGFRLNKMCLLLGCAGGSKGLSLSAVKNVRRVAARFEAFLFPGIAAPLWEKDRYSVPYFRDILQDFGFVLDTLECGVCWSNMGRVYRELYSYVNSLPQTLCMTHVEHMSPQGADLCLTFITRMRDPEKYRKFRAGFTDLVVRYDASISGHYGIGKLGGPWLESYLGRNEYAVIRALKRHFDPGNIMNPGGALGLDLDEKDKRSWGGLKNELFFLNSGPPGKQILSS
ncbi:MAG: FAD-binding oxidoreductase [Treponema sp.]|nr:FAD-binding oxidoreductase [Treponema sp.]